MSEEINEPWFLKVCDELEAFSKRVDDKIEKEQQRLKAFKKKAELETKYAHELKLNAELSARLAELSKRGSNLDRVCASFETHLTIADSDQNRLDNAKESYQIAKELTGIRLDFSAPPDVAKGYIKNESRKLLLPFEYDMTSSDYCNAIWSLIQSTATPGWPAIHVNKENRGPNIAS